MTISSPYSWSSRSPRDAMLQRPPRRGLSIIEVLVAIGIIAILAAVLLPTIQTARATARRIDCGSRLRQIWIASESYLGIFRVFPNASGVWPRQILPHIGTTQTPEAATVLTCPSDQEHATGDLRRVQISFAMNDGHGNHKNNGVVAHDGDGISLGEVTDGLSTTAAFSERLAYPWFAPSIVDWDAHQSLWNRVPRRIYSHSSDLEELSRECRDHAGKPRAAWYHTYNYCHLMPPNHNNCVLFPSERNPRPSALAIVTASSPHPGGTQTVCCDGALHFVSNHIDASVWMALGSRNGGEVDASHAF